MEHLLPWWPFASLLAIWLAVLGLSMFFTQERSDLRQQGYALTLQSAIVLLAIAGVFYRASTALQLASVTVGMLLILHSMIAVDADQPVPLQTTDTAHDD